MNADILFELALKTTEMLTANLKTESEIQETLRLVSELIAVKNTTQQ